MNLFGGTGNKKKQGELQSAPDFSHIMSFHRWCEIKALIPLMMEGEDTCNDPWWKFRGFVDGFNFTWKEKLVLSKMHVLDESMLEFGQGKSNLYYYFSKQLCLALTLSVYIILQDYQEECVSQH